ncbi:recombinase family protein [Exiguobacterium sp. s102]|uniref:recombinase family protein n=1 Tax=Exiguobacterium sp. s102 TaxID=2751212 RepID=UPI001BE918A7|nr:recombinase family protein [Exiguobacterium sp. s102]
MEYGYVRVSAIDQNYEIQIEKLVAYGVKEENIFHDKASGKDKERKGLTLLMETLQEGDSLIVYKLDRLARSMRHLTNMAHELHERGIRLVFINEQIDFSTSVGRLLFNMMGSIAEFERDIISERVIEGRVRAKERGVRFGRRRVEDDETKRLALENAIEDYKEGKKPLKTIIASSGVSRPTFYKKLRHYKVIV